MEEQMEFDIDDWCDAFKKAKQAPMDDELSRVFIACMTGGVNRELIEKQFLYQVVVKRAEALELEIEQSLIDFIALLCKTPGESTMYLAFLKNQAVKGIRANSENFVFVFQDGFPDQEELSLLWDMQKLKDAPLGNALDVNWWV